MGFWSHTRLFFHELHVHAFQSYLAHLSVLFKPVVKEGTFFIFLAVSGGEIGPP